MVEIPFGKSSFPWLYYLSCDYLVDWRKGGVVENFHFTEMRTSKKSFYGTLSQMRCARNTTHNNGFKY